MQKLCKPWQPMCLCCNMSISTDEEKLQKDASNNPYNCYSLRYDMLSEPEHVKEE